MREQLILKLGLHEPEGGNYPTSACVFGPLGCGKTSFLRGFPHGLECYKDTIAIHFEKQDFKATDPSVIDILNSLSRQVLCHVPSVFSHINHFYQFLCNHEFWSENLLLSLVRHLLEGIRYRLVLLIDDIDDWCSSFRNILEKLESFRQSGKFGLYVVYTATSEGQRLMSGPFLSIDLAEEKTRKEIAQKTMTSVIGDQLGSEYIEKSLSPELQSISESCLTSYLYIKQVSRLDTVTTPFILNKVLPKLPHTREGAYQAELEMITGNNQDVLQWCWGSLSWLVQATRPLTISELAVAAALHHTGSETSRNEIKNHISARMWEDLDRHLGLFVNTDGSHLKLVHGTAKEYLLSYNHTTDGKGYGISSHAEITTLCLRYLKPLMETYDDATAKEHLEYGFVRYSVENWPRHYQSAVDGGRVDHADLDNLIFRFFCHEGTWRAWIKEYQKGTYPLVHINPMEVDRLEAACGLGQVNLVSRLLELETCWGNKDLLHRSLDVAVRNFQSAVIPVLLRAGAWSETALCSAAERNMADVVGQLLDHTTANGKVNLLERAITTAAAQGSVEAITKLYSYYADTENLGQIQRSAVDNAAAGGHATIVSFLLSQPPKGGEDRRSSDSPSPPDASSTRAEMLPDTLTPQYVSALDIAAMSGDAYIVSLLLDAGTKATDSVLESASKRQNTTVLRILIKSLASQNYIPNNTMALHFAAERGYLDIVTELLAYGVNIDGRVYTNKTPLHSASTQGPTDVVRLLLQRGAERSAKDDQGAMPCHLAAQEGHIETYKALQQEPEAREDDLLVHYAAKGGHFLTVRYLLSLKLISVGPGSRNTLNLALLEATSQGYLSVVRELCAAGLDLNSRTGKASPLHQAASGGYADIVSYLINKGADVNTRDEAKRTPLHLGVSYPKVIELLLESGADPNAIDLDERSPLHIAAKVTQGEKAEACVRMLLRKGANINIVDENMNTPLHHASICGTTETVRALLDFEADVEIKNQMGRIAFHDAVVRNHLEVAKLLLAQGSDINQTNHRGMTPLYQAAQRGFTEMVRFLLDNEANHKITTLGGWTALGTAADYGRLEATQLLIEGGADIHHKAKAKATPLHSASRKGHIQVVELLLKHGADPNVQTQSGATPLHMAASRGHVQVVQALLLKSADIKALDGRDRTAFQVATESAAEILEKAENPTRKTDVEA